MENESKVEEYVKMSLDRYDELKAKIKEQEEEIQEHRELIIDFKDLFLWDKKLIDKQYTVKSLNTFIEDVANILGLKLKDKYSSKVEQQFYETIELKDIKVPRLFKREENPRKLQSKLDFYNKNGYLKEIILLNENNKLIDGYTSYLIAKQKEFPTVQIIRFKNKLEV